MDTDNYSIEKTWKGKSLKENKTYHVNLRFSIQKLEWKNAMTVPPEVAPIQVTQAPTVNNLRALGSFLEEIKEKPKVTQQTLA